MAIQGTCRWAGCAARLPPEQPASKGSGIITLCWSGGIGSRSLRQVWHQGIRDVSNQSGGKS
eukprot:3298930-Amphidinium_carterae.1